MAISIMQNISLKIINFKVITEPCNLWQPRERLANESCYGSDKEIDCTMAQKDHEWTREKKRNGQEEEGIRIKCKHLSKKKEQSVHNQII